MNTLKILGYNTMLLCDFLLEHKKELITRDVIIEKFQNILIAFPGEKLQTPNFTSYRNISWEEIEDLMDAYMVKENHFCNEKQYLDSKRKEKEREKGEWFKVHEIIGPELTLFLVQNTNLFKTRGSGVLIPFDPEKVSYLMKNAVFRNKLQSNAVLFENKKAKFLQILSSKCKVYGENTSKIDTVNASNSSVIHIERHSSSSDYVIQNETKQYHLESAGQNETAKKLRCRKRNKKPSHISKGNKSMSSGTSKKSKKKKINKPVVDSKIKKKQKKHNNNNKNNNNNRGYKETKPLSNWRIMFSRSTHEQWPTSHILATSPETRIGASALLESILLKDVGQDVFKSEQMKDIRDSLPNLKVLLLDLIKRHKKRSPYTYLIRRYLGSGRKKTKDVDFSSVSISNEESFYNTDIDCSFSTNNKYLNQETGDELLVELPHASKQHEKNFQQIIANSTGSLDVTSISNDAGSIDVTSAKCLDIEEITEEETLSNLSRDMFIDDVDDEICRNYSSKCGVHSVTDTEGMHLDIIGNNTSLKVTNLEMVEINSNSDSLTDMFSSNFKNGIGTSKIRANLETVDINSDSDSLTDIFSSDFKTDPGASEISSQNYVDISVAASVDDNETYLKNGSKRLYVQCNSYGNSRKKKCNEQVHIQNNCLNNLMNLQSKKCGSHFTSDLETSVANSDFPDSGCHRLSNSQDCCYKSLNVVQKCVTQEPKSLRNTMKEQPVEQKAVTECIRIITRKVVPYLLLGSKKNRRLFEKLCSKIVYSGRFQTFRLGSFVRRFKLSNIPWLSSVNTLRLKENIFAKLVLWLFEEYVMVLIKTHFYVTEVSHERNKLVFYSKPVFQRINDIALSNMVKNKKLRQITQKQAEKIEATSQFPGRATLRFLPKTIGARPVTMIRYRPEIVDKVRRAHIYLTQYAASYSHSMRPQATAKFHRLWYNLWSSWKRDGHRPLYFVRTDIVDAYGSIQHDRLCTILEEIIPDNKFALKTYECFAPCSGKLTMKRRYAFDHLHYVMPEDCVLIENNQQDVCGQELLDFLCKMIRSHIICIGNRKYIMKCGLPQGGRLSAILCDIYYSHMDRKYLKEFFSNEEDLLLRAVDDYLFVTTEMDRAKRFLETLEMSISEYGCGLNSKKTQTNIPYKQGFIDKEVTFCGYVIDIKTLEIRGEYARYENQDIAHSLRLGVERNPGLFLRKRLSLMTTLKLNAISIDERYNTRSTVFLNIFHAALLLAFRFHSIVKNTFDPKNLNQVFLTKMVCESAGRVGCRVLRVANLHCKDSTLDFNSVCWLTYRAFQLRLSLRGGQYPGVLRAIKWLLRSVSRRIQDDILSELKILTKQMPSSFKTIK